MATSTIKGGTVEFSLIRGSDISGGEGNGVYDRRSGLVRINFFYNNGTTAIPATTVLFTVPAAYRPRTAKTGSGTIWANNLMAGTPTNLGTDGTIKQTQSGTKTRGYGYIEYALN